MPQRTRAKARKRSPSWIGINVAVCGHQIPVEGADCVCLLPPKHPEDTPHSTLVVEGNIPYIVILREDHTEWLSPKE